MRPSIFLLVVLLGCATCVFAQAPYLVKDIGNPQFAQVQSSQPSAFLASGNTLFFLATTETNGREPWVHDANGTRLLRDINAGPSSSNVSRFLELTPGIAIFTADDGMNGQQLWRSDGTEAGTILVKIVNASTTVGVIPGFSYGGKVFFYVDDGVHGSEPWVTDGTADGTQLLADTQPNTFGTAAQFFRFANKTRFLTTGGIWTTDGTPAGTTLDVPLYSARFNAAITDTAIYFFAYDFDHGYELWKSDGTPGGTALLKDIRPGPLNSVGSVAIAPTSTGGVVFSVANDGTGAGIRLWTTDGTAANTVPISAFPTSGLPSNYAFFFYPTSKGVFLSAYSTITGQSKIWRTDGTEAGTYVAATIPGGPGFAFTDAFSKIYFSGWLDGTLSLLWIDGTPGQTAVNVLPNNSISDLVFTGGKLWFSGKDSTNGSELWVSDDGTTNGTHLVANLAPDPARSSTPISLKPVGSYLYFIRQSPRELWRSDGTSGGTFEFASLDNTSVYSFTALTPFHGDIYYFSTQSDLYRVDGVTGAPTKIGSYGLGFSSMTVDENFLYLWGSSSSVLRSDGTTAGTIPLYDPNEPNHLCESVSDNSHFLTDGSVGWIRCYHAIFRTAGSVETTRRILTIPQNDYLTGEFATAGGLLYSAISKPATGTELWRTDGTGAGSFTLKDANSGAASANPARLTPAGRLLFFTATDPAHGTELWRTDGTAAGTFMVRDIRPGAAASAPSALAALGDVVYFAANDGAAGIELWKSDGTEAGTVLVRDIAPGSFSSTPARLAAADGKIWFSANDGLHGFEMWTTDGTDAGTLMVGDIIPGSASSSPDQFTAAESLLFFTATTDETGRELWAFPLTSGSITVTGARTLEGNSGTRTLRFTLTRHGASAAAASVAYSTSPGTASAEIDYDSASGTIPFAAGETVKTVDVVIHGDTDNEPNETLFLNLSAPTGVALQSATAAGVIDDDDPSADLAADILQNTVVGGQSALRLLKVTNNGPSSASGITVTFTESPYDFIAGSTTSDVTCTHTMPMQCTIPFLLGGDSRTLAVYRDSIEGLVDPSLPPGRTVTMSVAAAVPDPDLSNNSASRMTTSNGMLLLPSQLVVGTSATASFDLGNNAESATDVTLTSSAGNVLVNPATVRIEAGQRTASFTLTTSAGSNKTLLTAAIAGETKAALVAPIVASGQSALLDVAIVAQNKSMLAYGELFIIPVRIAARDRDGTLPAGVVTLLAEDGTSLSQVALDTAGAATLTPSQPAPGTYHYRVRYEGDSRFNPLTVSLPTITIQKAPTTVVIHAPTVTCSNTVEFRIVVTGPEGTAAPTGTFTLSDSSNNYGTFALTPTGVSGQSEGTVSQSLPNGGLFMSVTYSGDDYFATSIMSKMLSVGCTAMSFVATATSPTSIALSWVPPAQTTNQYGIYRSDSIEGTFQFLASTTGLNAVDITVQPGRLYLYYILAYGDGNVPYYNSNVDIASTFNYTDNPLASGMVIKSAHFVELRTMTAALRALAALSSLTFTGSVTPGSVVDARHISELRTSIDASRARIGLPAIAWTQPTGASGAIIRAATLQELRAAAN